MQFLLHFSSMISGTIPSSLGNLSRLKSLILHNQSLVWLLALKHSQFDKQWPVCSLQNNQLHGNSEQTAAVADDLVTYRKPINSVEASQDSPAINVKELYCSQTGSAAHSLCLTDEMILGVSGNTSKMKYLNLE